MAIVHDRCTGDVSRSLVVGGSVRERARGVATPVVGTPAPRSCVSVLVDSCSHRMLAKHNVSATREKDGHLWLFPGLPECDRHVPRVVHIGRPAGGPRELSLHRSERWRDESPLNCRTQFVGESRRPGRRGCPNGYDRQYRSSRARRYGDRSRSWRRGPAPVGQYRKKARRESKLRPQRIREAGEPGGVVHLLGDAIE